MTRIHRREAMTALAASTLTVAGCDSAARIEEAVDNTPTETLENARLSLRGFQIVAFTVGRRIVQLPHPAVRVLGVALLTTGVATFLIVEYLDVELKRRSIREALEQDERAAIESSLAIEFMTENGLTEKVALGPNQYEQ